MKFLISNLSDIEIIELKLMTMIALTDNPIEHVLTEGKISFSSRTYGLYYQIVVEYLKNGITNIFASSTTDWGHFLGRNHPCARKTYLSD